MIRAAFDVGSGSTKLRIAKVDPAQQKIIETYEVPAGFDNQKVAYMDSLTESGAANAFSPSIIKQGENTISRLKIFAASQGATEFAGVATGPFRIAGNSEQALGAISENTAVRVQKISQSEEGKLGYLAAFATSSTPADKLVVWDIGGATMQVTSYAPGRRGGEQDGFTVYQRQEASTKFKEELIAKNSPNKTSKSPNPISAAQFAEAVALAEAKAKANPLPREIKSILNDKSHEVIGISGVHAAALVKFVGKNGYTAQDLQAAFDKLLAEAGPAGITDDFLTKKFPQDSNYKESDIANIALVLGSMRGYGITRVLPKAVNLANGVLVSNKYYQSSSDTPAARKPADAKTGH